MCIRDRCKVERFVSVILNEDYYYYYCACWDWGMGVQSCHHMWHCGLWLRCLKSGWFGFVKLRIMILGRPKTVFLSLMVAIMKTVINKNKIVLLTVTVTTLCLKKTTLMLQAISSTHINRFLPRCMECRRGLAMRILSVRLFVRPSVCPSVRLSVKRVHCDKTEESYV